MRRHWENEGEGDGERGPWRRYGRERETSEEEIGLGLEVVGVGWALEAGPVERAAAPRRGWACLAGLSSPCYLFLKQKKTKKRRKRKEKLGEEVGHGVNFPRLTKM